MTEELPSISPQPQASFTPSQAAPPEITAAPVLAAIAASHTPAETVAATQPQDEAVRPAQLYGWQNLEAPPRSVPPSLDYKVRFGNFRALFGLMLLLPAVIILASSIPETDFKSFGFKSGNTTSGSGVIYLVQDSGVNYSGSPVDKLSYVSSLGSGAVTDGVSYAPRLVFTKGDRVETEHLKSNPAVSRIKNTRLNPLPVSALLTLPIPLFMLGLIFTISGIRSGGRMAELLKSGRLTEGSVATALPMFLNTKTHMLYRVNLTYPSPDGRVRALNSWARTNAPVGNLDRLPVLFNPLSPDHAEVPGPLGFTITARGRLAPAKFGSFYALLPAGVMLTIILAAAYWLSEGFHSPFRAF